MHNVTVKVVNSGLIALSLDKFTIVNDYGESFQYNVSGVVLRSGNTEYLINISSDNCSRINNSLAANGYVYIGSINCSEIAYDNFPGSFVNFASC